MGAPQRLLTYAQREMDQGPRSGGKGRGHFFYKYARLVSIKDDGAFDD